LIATAFNTATHSAAVSRPEHPRIRKKKESKKQYMDTHNIPHARIKIIHNGSEESSSNNQRFHIKSFSSPMSDIFKF